MNKLSKDQLARLEALRAEYAEAVAAVAASQEAAREAIEKATNEVNEKIDELNAVIANADELRDQISSAIDDHIAEKSDAWQEGERGQAFAAWRDQWSETLSEIEHIEVEVPEVEVPEDMLPGDQYPESPDL